MTDQTPLLVDLDIILKTLVEKDQKFQTWLYTIQTFQYDFSYRTDGFLASDLDNCTEDHCVEMQNAGVLTRKENAWVLAVPLEDFERALHGLYVSPVRCEPLHEGKVVITDQQRQLFEGLVGSGTDLVDYWSGGINPKVEGLFEIKRAILLCLASHGDRHGDRGRVHVLMYGEPGSAKTVLKDWIVYQLGAESCSQRTTKVGLTGDARGKEITPGALPRAHKGVLCIDELDKFSQSDRQGLLEAMEEGVVQIEAGGMSERFPAECRVIACANRITEFSPELMDRFDFKFEMKTPKGDQMKTVMRAIIDHWFMEKDGYTGEDLRAYLEWCRNYEPNIHMQVREQAKEIISLFLDLDDKATQGVRARESILRVAYTIAKVNHRDLNALDILRAIKITNPQLNGGKISALQQLTDKLILVQA
jgi:DNA replicative helicase MCM subunit Mcm2 (Cdc46/Mcm family)